MAPPSPITVVNSKTLKIARLNSRPDLNAMLLEPETKVAVGEIVTRNALQPKLKPKSLVLFAGPPGTGKRLAAEWIGDRLKRKVVRFAYDQAFLKYIGETEKNLAALFDRAERLNHILLFDEADALFGNRSDLKPARVKYVNRIADYIFERIENSSHLVIFTAPSRENIENVYQRRFDSIVDFPIPSTTLRRLIWRRLLSELAIPPIPEAKLKALATKYPISQNTIRQACLNLRRQASTKTDDPFELDRIDKTVDRILAGK